MSSKVRWGIIGSGEIATQFAEAISFVKEAELVAVASRSHERAKSFADKFAVLNSYTSYDELLKSSNIDVVYVATPNNLHHKHSLMCLHAGKHLLCEKPFSLNAKQAREITSLAAKNNLFCMEAMWTRFIPTVRECFRKVKAGEIGRPRLFIGDFGYQVPFNPDNRLYNLEAGGGALLDLAVYPISLSYGLFGPPTKIQTAVDKCETGVDQCSALTFEYQTGQIALIYSSFTTQTPTEARIMGDSGNSGNSGNIKKAIKRFPLVQKTALSLEKYATAILAARRAKTDPFIGNGYNYQIQEVCNCILSGKIESEIMPLEETIGVMEIMDEVRSQWGLQFTPDDSI